MELEDHDRGLAFDLKTMSRRSMLGSLARAGMMVSLVGCGAAVNGSSSDGSNTGNSAANEVASTGCGAIPTETEGPYPGDGSNGPNALATTGVVRSDIRSSFNGLSGTAAGIPITVILTIVNSNASCIALPGYTVYLWHCDQGGQYSLYDLPAQNYLRGVQEADSAGQVIFTSIFPGCYAGRWPHMHFEVFPSLASATSAANKVRTSQLALTTNACNQVYATSGYASSQSNFSRVSLSTDNVFSDGWDLQIPELTGDVTNGFTLRLQVGVPV